jgi:hypothetical protein
MRRAVQEFLLEVHTSPPGEADLPALAEILSEQLLPPPPGAGAPGADVAVQLTALRWLHELIELGGEALAPQYASMLRAVLPCLADDSSDICQASSRRAVRWQGPGVGGSWASLGWDLGCWMVGRYCVCFVYAGMSGVERGGKGAQDRMLCALSQPLLRVLLCPATSLHPFPLILLSPLILLGPRPPCLSCRRPAR